MKIESKFVQDIHIYNCGNSFILQSVELVKIEGDIPLISKNTNNQVFIQFDIL